MKHPLVRLARTVESAQERVDDQEKGRMVAVASELPTTGYALEWTISLLRWPLPGGICRPIGYGAPGREAIACRLSPVRSDERHLSGPRWRTALLPVVRHYYLGEFQQR
jgi:hypothetical protein